MNKQSVDVATAGHDGQMRESGSTQACSRMAKGKAASRASGQPHPTYLAPRLITSVLSFQVDFVSVGCAMDTLAHTWAHVVQACAAQTK